MGISFSSSAACCPISKRKSRQQAGLTHSPEQASPVFLHLFYDEPFLLSQRLLEPVFLLVIGGADVSKLDSIPIPQAREGNISYYLS